jgi:hypothetical protein
MIVDTRSEIICISVRSSSHVQPSRLELNDEKCPIDSTHPAKPVSPRECLDCSPPLRLEQQTSDHGTPHRTLLYLRSPRRSRESKVETYAMSNLPRSQPSQSRLSTIPSQKPRQLSHLQAQLAQLTANMADLESLMRMTAGQAQDMRGLGGYAGGL